MLRLLAIAALVVLLMEPCGDLVIGAIETGYQVRESNTRLAVSVAQSSAGGVKVVPAGAYEVPGEE